MTDEMRFRCANNDMKEVYRTSEVLLRNYCKALVLQGADPTSKKGEEILQSFCSYIKSINKVSANDKEQLHSSITSVLEDYASKKKTIGRQIDFLNVFNSSAGTDCKEVDAMEAIVVNSGCFDQHMREAIPNRTICNSHLSRTQCGLQ